MTKLYHNTSRRGVLHTLRSDGVTASGHIARTGGGLTKKDFVKTKTGWKSRAASQAAKRRWNSPEYAHVKAAFAAMKFAKRKGRRTLRKRRV